MQTTTHAVLNDEAYWRTDPNVVTMERLRDGDMDAFGVLFSKYSDAIAAFAYGYLHSRDHAEEVSQTVFLQLLRTRERYRPTARFTTFLYRITSNLCLNELRRSEYSCNFESLDGDDTTVVDRLADTESPGPAKQLADREAVAEVVKLLARVPSNQRMALLLSRVDGLTYEEIAERLDTSRSAVKSQVFRVTATLRKRLARAL